MRLLLPDTGRIRRAISLARGVAVRDLLPLAVLIFCAVRAGAAPNSTEPHVSYLFPAGGQRGTVVRAWVGGQYLGGMNRVYVSGEGVHAKVLFYARPLNTQDFDELRRRQAERTKAPGAEAAESKPLSNNPLIDVLDALSPKELQTVLDDFFNPNTKRQPNAQISETAFLELTIDPEAPVGDRELRIGTPAGLTNPVCFQVGALPEVFEVQPFGVLKPPTPLLEPPVVANGQITPGDVDRYRVRARKGQQLVIRAQARRLNPYLADAVPGWFQAVLALYNPKGDRIALEDDYRFDPDPVLAYLVPEDGEYTVEIRDAIYRGREDFVYRISVAEQPFVTRIFPLGGQEGAEAFVSLAGWNLTEKRLRLDTRPGGGRLRWAALPPGDGSSGRIAYAVDTLPEQVEKEPNSTVKDAMPVVLPLTINGILHRAGDLDLFRFTGRAGEEVVAEVTARTLGSPLDSLLRLTDASGKVLAWNDDRKESGVGLLTHQADSYLRARLPRDGVYFVHLSDSQGQGDEARAYRLRLSAPRPDFALWVTPSSVNVPGTGVIPLTVYARRGDGFDGGIELALKDAPAGFRVSGRVPPGKESARVILAAPPGRQEQPLALQLEGRAQIGGVAITRPAAPATEMMQAFFYWHQVPARELLVDLGRERRTPAAELVEAEPARIPAGGSAPVAVKVPWRWALPTVTLQLVDPPKGISLGEVTHREEVLTFAVKADGGATKPGEADNLIVEAFAKTSNGGRYSLGLLPAVPFEVVAP